jgi:glycosyltransferase involved in cell wall biosynthesis
MLALLPITLLCVLVACWCVQDVARELRAPRIAPRAGAPIGGPLVSALIPARDEAARIGACLDGLARQRYRNFELIVVDDDSTDGTAEVVRTYADRIPGLRVAPGAALPDGWAGKPWACWQAAAHAHGEWLLFLDADVAPGPDLLAALVARAESRRLDVLTLMPLLQLGSLAERLALPAFMSLLYGLYPLDRVNDRASPIAFANGQCMLVRRAAYDSLDGHRAVRDSILEDTHFGQRAKAAGLRLEAAAAPDLIAVRMYTGWRSLAEGLSKNAAAGFRSGGARSSFVAVRQALIAFLPFVLLVGSRWDDHGGSPLQVVLAWHGIVLAMITLATYAWLARRRYRLGAAWGILYPLGLAIYFGLAGVAFVRLATGRGVVWKGRVVR